MSDIRPELTIAGLTVAAAAAAGYLVAGPAGLGAVAIVAAAVSLAVLRVLLPPGEPDATRKAKDKQLTRTISGYSHRRFVVATAPTSVGFYESELRPALEHIFAARLAERHGLNLYRDRDAARRLLCRGQRDDTLWYWIDPDLESDRKGEPRGIPNRTLARLIDRLEQL